MTASGSQKGNRPGPVPAGEGTEQPRLHQTPSDRTTGGHEGYGPEHSRHHPGARIHHCARGNRLRSLRECERQKGGATGELAAAIPSPPEIVPSKGFRKNEMVTAQGCRADPNQIHPEGIRAERR